jgi:hypothetical protein
MMQKRARSALRGRSLILVLLLIVLWSGCKDPSRLVKEGTLFAASEKVSPGKALVYIYWPREEQGERNHLWVGSCEDRNDEIWSDEILPGGYMAHVMDPGPSCLQAEARSHFMNGRGSVSRPLGNVELNAEPGRTFFLRLEQEEGLLTSRAVLRLVDPEVAGPEIRRCRRSIPLTPEEMIQQYMEETMPETSMNKVNSTND